MAKTTTAIEVDASGGHAEKDQGFINPDATMLILTWVTFFLLLAILYKYAWKPILTALDKREADIRQSIEDADKIKAEMEQINETSQKIIAEASGKGKGIVDESKKAAAEAAKTIEHKAREESQILVENAKREIKEATNSARAQLRAESAQIAVELAGKIIEENLDNEKNKKLINQFIKEV